jgi:Mrp family chromosome partitioning ATPase
MAENECGSCSGGSCNTGTAAAAPDPEEARLQDNLSRIKHKFVVLSGKGGVGKSTVSTNIAVSLSLAGFKVGLLDVDVHGPSVPRALGLAYQRPEMMANHMKPVKWSDNLRVMSMGFLLPETGNDAVIWRGPVKMGLIKQFLQDVDWGNLDALVVDCPPGTGDEPLSVLQLLGTDAEAVIVTTPQGVAIDDVRRSVTFCSQVGNPVLGIVENMSGFVCKHCGEVQDIFGSGGGENLAKEMGVPFLGRIPMDPEVVRSTDEGYVISKVSHDGPVGQAIAGIIKPMIKHMEQKKETAQGITWAE